MKLIMTPIRYVLGRIILLLDWVFTPKSMVRTPEEQTKVDEQTKKMSLYQFKACPFCVKVRRAIKRLGLNIQTRDAKRVGRYRDDLLANGGKVKVPCLRIEKENGEVEWMYESQKIIEYLTTRFS